jgi:hypothetical protein
MHHVLCSINHLLSPPPRVHEDYVIVSIAPLPNHPLQFPAVQVVEEYLVEHMRVASVIFSQRTWAWC